MAYQILFIDGEIVFDGTAIVFTDDAASCTCCNTITVKTCDCSECPDYPGISRYVTVTVSGLTDDAGSGCTGCAGVNGTYVLDEACSVSNCHWRYTYGFTICGLAAGISFQLNDFETGTFPATWIQVGVGLLGAEAYVLFSEQKPSDIDVDCNGFSSGSLTGSSYVGGVICNRTGSSVSLTIP